MLHRLLQRKYGHTLYGADNVEVPRIRFKNVRQQDVITKNKISSPDFLFLSKYHYKQMQFR